MKASEISKAIETKVEETKEPTTKRERKKMYKEKPEYKESDLGRNNFVNSTFQIPVVRQYSKTQYARIEDDETGEIKWKKAKYDSEYAPITKVYIWPESRKDVNKLTVKAKEILLWIIYSVGSGDDYIEITRDNCMRELNISSQTTFLNAIKDLTRLNFIAPTGQRKDTYWINPHYFFNGDRMDQFETHKLLEYNYTNDDNLKLCQ